MSNHARCPRLLAFITLLHLPAAAQLPAPAFSGGVPMQAPMTTAIPGMLMPGSYQMNRDGWMSGSATAPLVAPSAASDSAVLNALRAKHGEDSPEYIEMALDPVCTLAQKKQFDEAQKLFDSWRPKAEALLKSAGKAAQTEERFNRLRSQIFRCLENLQFERGEYAEFVKTATAHLKQLRDGDSPEARRAEFTTAASLTHQLVELKRLAECRPWVVRAAEIVRKEAIDENELFITALLSISSDAKELGMTEEQRLFGERAIKSAEALPASSEKERLVSRLTLARIYMQQDRLLEAEAILNKLHGEIEKADPLDAKIHALIINNIGLLHQRIYDFQGGNDRLENAEKCFTEAYELAKQDGDNPLEAERAYCSRLANLAVIKVRKGKLGESTDMLKQAVEACEKRLGTDDQQTLDTLGTYALALEGTGRVKEAVEILRDLLRRCQQVFGDIHPRTGTVQHLLGSTLMKLGQYNEAETCYERSAGIRERIFGADHADTAKAYFNLGLIREAKADFPGASAYYGHVLKIDIKAHGQNSLTVAHDTAALARTLTQEGKFDEAVSHLNQHIAFIEKELGKENLLLSISLLSLAGIEEKRENYKAAENLFKRVIGIRVKNLGPEHHDVAGARAQYGLFLVSRNKLTLAATEIRRAAVLFARHHQREGASAADMRACIDIYGNILQRLHYDRQTIQKHTQNLESGIDPEEGKGKGKSDV